MKKIYGFAIMALMLVSLMGVASATLNDRTIIAGKIYNADYTSTIADADVDVDCDGFHTYTSSRSDGSYSVEWENPNDCQAGDPLVVTATKGGLYGSQSGIIHDSAIENWDLAVVNVPLVPEFGVIAGSLTIMGALGIFFMVRKK